MSSPDTHVLTIRRNVLDGLMSEHTIIARGPKERMVRAAKALTCDDFWHTNFHDYQGLTEQEEKDQLYTFSAPILDGHLFVIPANKIADFQNKTKIKVVP